MATTTPNYGWPVPTSTDYVKDGATAIEALGDAIDATVFGLGSSALSLVTAQSFSAVSAVNVNNCFTATYVNYKVLLFVDPSTNCNFDFRYRASGADNSTANYRYVLPNVDYGGTGTIFLIGQGTTNMRIGTSSTGARPSTMAFDFLNPQALEDTYMIWSHAGETRAGAGGARFAATTQFDGFSILPDAGTVTGTVRVYGYEN
jgi:hypothetical protein